MEDTSLADALAALTVSGSPVAERASPPKRTCKHTTHAQRKHLAEANGIPADVFVRTEKMDDHPMRQLRLAIARRKGEVGPRQPAIAPDATAGWRIMLARMGDGWWAQPDVIQLMPEYAAGSVRAWLYQRAWQGGHVERALNPAFDVTLRHLDQGEPQWLYRVTAAGRAQI
jgi:hypothetical protein